MDDVMYLLDTVTVWHLDEAQLKSSLVQSKCFVPEEIFYELGNSKKGAMLSDIVYGMDASILEYTEKVLARTKSPSCPFDLYNNTNNGDILLLATALKESESEAKRLAFTRIAWKIVTEDGSLGTLAKEMGIDVLSTKEFVQLL